MTNRSILVIDDDSSVRELVAEILRQQGFKVLTAVSGQSALAILQTMQTPDLILIDLIMPGMDGIQFIERLRSDDQFKNLPVILLTAESNPEFLSEVATLNLAGLLLKPVGAKKLIEKVEKTLSKLKPK